MQNQTASHKMNCYLIKDHKKKQLYQSFSTKGYLTWLSSKVRLSFREALPYGKRLQGTECCSKNHLLMIIFTVADD